MNGKTAIKAKENSSVLTPHTRGYHHENAIEVNRPTPRDACLYNKNVVVVLKNDL
jgi:hypothetical protein